MNKTLIYAVVLICGMALGIGIVSLFNKDETSVQEQTNPVIWTCSMHPEIRQDEPGLCPLCNMDLTPLDQDVGTHNPKMFQLNERALALANVDTYTVQAGSEEVASNSFTGKIEATDAAIKSQATYVSGRIEKLYVNTTGMMVQRGQILATIYSPELLSSQQELLSAYKRKEQSPSLYQAVHNKLLQWKWSEAQIQNLIETQEVQPNFPIRAMVSGEVIDKKVSEGAYVTAGQELFEIADLQTVWGVINVSEEQINQIAIGSKVELSTSSQKEIIGKVDFIYPLVDPATRTVQVRMEIPNIDKKLKPGMLLHAKIATTGNHDAQIFVPKSAVLWTGKRSVVYVVHKEEGNTFFEMREVTLGSHLGDNYEVLEGLEPLEEVVHHGTFTIDAAAQLQGYESMMNRKESLEIHLSESDENKLMAFMPYYFELKDIFVSSDAKEIATYARDTDIDALKITLEDKAHELWHVVTQQWQQIAKESDLEKQRLAFKKLNQNLLPIAHKIVTHPETWYVQECPMADNYNGGQWISLEETVINPYFGDAMLNCGSIEEVW